MTNNLIQIVNARLVDGDRLVSKALWFNPETGVFVSPPSPAPPASVIDLQNRIVSPGFLDLQINGAYGFDFSEDSADVEGYNERFRDVRRKLIATGTTSFLPTMTSQFPERYHQVSIPVDHDPCKRRPKSRHRITSHQNLPLLGPSRSRDPWDGCESLGAHCEGPFFAHNRMGVHLPDAIHTSGATSEPEVVSKTYGRSNLVAEGTSPSKTKEPGKIPSHVRMITMAPERPGALDTLRWLSSEGIVMSIGHMAADFDQARAGIEAGASMITHLFNQMNGHHHREPGPLGILGGADGVDDETETGVKVGEDGGLDERETTRPYFGIIADGSHVHPASVRLANHLHPEGLILVTDALLLLGGEDGTIDWLTRRLTKKGISVKLEGTDIIAGRFVSGCLLLTRL